MAVFVHIIDKRLKRVMSMNEPIYGVVYEHQQTKKLLQYVPKKSIVFLWHCDLDGVAVNGLLEAEVKAIINMYPTYSVHSNIAMLKPY